MIYKFKLLNFENITQINSILMRFIQMTIMAMLISVSAISQPAEFKNITIAGVVKDSVSGKVIEYPTIAIFTDSLKLIKAQAAGADGKFFIEIPSKGKYVLSVSMMGYSTVKRELIIDGLSKRVEIGDIFLLEGVQMSGVTVVGVKPLIKNDPDKLTYNLESDPQSAASPLIDIIRKVPMLSVDGEGTVRLNGETNFKVLVNGRSTGILVKNFKDAIKSMPANSIKSIEVITDPPAKYDADGVAGIINIITNKKQAAGYNASISLTGNTLGGYSGGGYLSLQQGKFAMTSYLFRSKYFSNKSSSFSETENYISDQYKFSTVSSKYNSVGVSNQLSVDASYDIDSLNFISLSVFGYMGNSNSDGISEYISKNSTGIVTRNYLNTYGTRYEYGSSSGNLSYQKNYKKPEKNLTISYGIDYGPSNRKVINAIDAIVDFYPYEQNSKNDAQEVEQSFQFDFYNPLKKGSSFETGAKYILRQNISNTIVKLYNQNSGEWVEDPSKVNDLDYTQHIGSFYGGYLYKNKSITAKAGVRVELTKNDGVSKSADGNIRFDNNQFDIVPYLSVSYSLGKGKTTSLSYTQRLNRPGIWYLNPYVSDSDPMNISYGNPGLNTVKRHNLNLGYRQSSQKWNLGLNLSGDYTNNDIVNIRKVNTDGVNISTYENQGENKSIRLNFNYSYMNGQKYRIYSNGTIKYSDISSPEMGISNSGFSYSGYLMGSITVLKKGSIELGGYLFGGNITLQSKDAVNYMTSFGYSHRFLNDKLYFAAYVSEPFTKKKKFVFDSEDNTYRTHRESFSYQRSANFSLTWRIGKYGVQVKKAKKSSTDDKMKGETTTNP